VTEKETDAQVMEAAWIANLHQSEQLVRSRRWQLVDRLLMLVVVAFLLFVTVTNRATLSELRRQTSPERQARQVEAVKGIVLEIDCNSRRALQDVIDGLVEQGILPADSITLTCQ
jgi:competence protein ComGC